MRMRMNPFRLGLIALVLAAASAGGAAAQSSGTETFTAERWQRLTSPGEAFAGIRLRRDAAPGLFLCLVKDSRVTLTSHPATPVGLSNPPQVATLAFDGAGSLGAELTARAAPDGSILFAMHGDE